MRIKVYFLLLLLSLCYVNGYLYDYISPDLSYPINNNNDHIMVIPMAILIPICAFALGLILINSASSPKKFVFSLIVAAFMFLLILASAQLYLIS